MRRKTGVLAAAGAVIALAAAACSSGGSSSGTPTGSATAGATGFNAAVTSTVNPSSAKGGPVVFANSTGPDSTDAGNTYYAFNLNFTRLYATPLTTYKSCTGACGQQVVPALATSLGTATNGNKTWTYHLKSGVKFEDGTPVTSQDVKYAVERTFDRTVLPSGPSYFASLLAGNAAKYPGPFKNRSQNLMGLTSVQTPDPTTIVFQLKQPFADFNYVVAFPQTAPVPPAKDTGTNYQLHPLSTGPYMFQSYQLNKQYTLVPNPQWNPSWDPQVAQHASKITVDLNVNANDIDNRLLAGDIQVDQAGSGVQAAARARILSTPSLKSSADDPVTGFMWFYYVNTKVAPLNNLHCREAVIFAANKTELQTAYGGPFGGDIASTAIPPTVNGYSKIDPYNALTKPGGDITSAKQQLQAVRPSQRVQPQHRLPERPAARGRFVPGAAGVPGLGGYQGHAEGLPGLQLLQHLRRRAQLRAQPRPRPAGGRLGSGLARRLRLGLGPVRRRVDRAGREHQHRRGEQPGRQQPVRPAGGGHQRLGPDQHLPADRQAGHGRRGDAAGGVLQGPAVPFVEPDQRPGPDVLRHVQLRHHRVQVVG